MRIRQADPETSSRGLFAFMAGNDSVADEVGLVDPHGDAAPPAVTAWHAL
ncbi:MAG: hypothetical protein HT579_11345 [Candidatus Accumulibacter similis]|nr:MAG: hypothetical protein HT579_11345 [Candidatus Accumulibacter similis]